MDDLISRQAAIEELDRAAWGVDWDRALAKAMLESLPSAQPKLITCRIGHELTADEIESLKKKLLDDAPIVLLPSTQPERKKGRWIRHPEQKNIYGGKCVECSECGEKYVVQYIEDEKFCRNCGADMRGEDK